MQSALECKSCADATLLIVVVIVSTLGIFGIGVVLAGKKTASHIDTEAENLTLNNAEVGLHSCSAVLAVLNSGGCSTSRN